MEYHHYEYSTYNSHHKVLVNLQAKDVACRRGEERIDGYVNKTSSSAIAEGPRDALSQLKSCQLLHNCTKNHI